ncbi:MAG: N-glycosylase/DNA lyase [Candidatus Altiarchaeota archaeon]
MKNIKFSKANVKKLIERIKNLERDENLRDLVRRRITEFKNIGKSKKLVFSELCFCILTANWRADRALSIQEELSDEKKGFGFLNFSEKKLRESLKEKGHRFYPQRAKYICLARDHFDINEKLKNLKAEEAREFLVKNIKGLGYKEASHFLRNIGYKEIAIIDRHILNLLFEYNIINEKPKNLTKRGYIEIEKILSYIAKKLNMSLAELDLYMWYTKTGKILK